MLTCRLQRASSRELKGLGEVAERVLPPVVAQVLVRMSFGMDAGGNVAMKLVVRADAAEASEAVHSIIQNA